MTPSPEIKYERRFKAMQICTAIFAAAVAICHTYSDDLPYSQLCIRLLLIGLAYWIISRLARRVSQSSSFARISPGLLAPSSVYVYFFIIAYGTRWQGAASGMLVVVPLFLGIAVFSAGLMHRVGDSLHCPHCEYPYEFPNDADAPIRCPECGKGWLGILKKGHKVKSRKLIITGILIAILGTILLNPIFYIGSLAPSLPTPLLYASSYLLPTSNYTAWDELATRKLNPFWTRLMANRVMGLRRQNPYEVSSRWFEQVMLGGTISAEQSDQYYEQALVAHLIVPDHVVAGVPFPVFLNIPQYSNGSSTQVCVMFAGYYVDDSPSPIGRKNESLWMHMLRPASSTSHSPALRESITISQKGEAKVRCIFWLLHQGNFSELLKGWDGDSPRLRGGVIWSRRYELTKTVHVD